MTLVIRGGIVILVASMISLSHPDAHTRVSKKFGERAGRVYIEHMFD
jgi:hypothetical protein